MKPGIAIAYLALSAAAACLPIRAGACTSAEVAVQVKQLGYWKDPFKFDPDPMFHCFVEHGPEAAGLLVKELRLVPDTDIVAEDQANHRDVLHVIWVIRSLRAITGIDQMGGSAQELKARKPHKHLLDALLFDSGEQVRFFGVFMAHEHLVTAPQDIQKEIIGKWNDWYKTQGTSYKYRLDENIDFIYYD